MNEPNPHDTAEAGQDHHRERDLDDALYEWLLSDHPDARAERDRRREATYQDERERTGKVLAWVEKIDATPDAPETMRDLAATMGPLAAKSAAHAEAAFAEPDEAFVARARANHETYCRYQHRTAPGTTATPAATSATPRPANRGRASSQNRRRHCERA